MLIAICGSSRTAKASVSVSHHFAHSSSLFCLFAMTDLPTPRSRPQSLGPSAEGDLGQSGSSVQAQNARITQGIMGTPRSRPPTSLLTKFLSWINIRCQCLLLLGGFTIEQIGLRAAQRETLKDYKTSVVNVYRRLEENEITQWPLGENAIAFFGIFT